MLSHLTQRHTQWEKEHVCVIAGHFYDDLLIPGYETGYGNESPPLIFPAALDGMLRARVPSPQQRLPLLVLMTGCDTDVYCDSKHSCPTFWQSVCPPSSPSPPPSSSTCRLDWRWNGHGCWGPPSSSSSSPPRCTRDSPECRIINTTGATCSAGSCRGPSWQSWW